MNYEEIVKALKTIKDVCESTSHCIDCIFYHVNDSSNNMCGINHGIPNNWKIKDITELNVIRVFK